MLVTLLPATRHGDNWVNGSSYTIACIDITTMETGVGIHDIPATFQNQIDIAILSDYSYELAKSRDLSMSALPVLNLK